MKKYLSKKNPQSVAGCPPLTIPTSESSDPQPGIVSSEPTTPASLGGLIAHPHPTLMRSNTISGLPQTNVAQVLQSLYPGTFPHIAANLFRLSAATGVPNPSGQPLATVAGVHAAAAALSKHQQQQQQQQQQQRLLASPPVSVSSSTTAIPAGAGRKLQQVDSSKSPAVGSSSSRPDLAAAARFSSRESMDENPNASAAQSSGCSSSNSSIRRSKGQPYIPSYMDLSNGPEPCVVCGDAATGYHYRCMTCEGCKGFFRRTIQKSLQYHCKWSGNCIIDKNTRNQCQKCRFEKCIAVGMATDLVLNERQRLAKRKLIEENRARRRQEQVRMRGRGDGSIIEETLTDEDVNIIETIRTAYEEAELRRARNLFGAGPSEKDALRQLRETPEANRLTNIMTPAIIKVVDFAKAIPDFVKLPLDDQIVLLKASCLEIMCLRTASRFCKESGTLPLRNGTTISRDDLETLITQDSSATLYEPIFDFAYNLSKLDLDPSEVALLAATLVTQTDRSGLKDDSAVENIQDQILGTFKRYVAAHRPENPLHWAKIIMKVTDLRSICQVHAERVLLNSLETSSKLMPSFLALFGEYEDFEFAREDSGEASEMEELLPSCSVRPVSRPTSSSHRSDNEDGTEREDGDGMEFEDGSQTLLRQTSSKDGSPLREEEKSWEQGASPGEEEEEEENMVGIEEDEDEDEDLESRPLTIKLPSNFDDGREREEKQRQSEDI